MINNIKIQRNRYNKSLLKWIVSNNKMSIFEKLKRILVFLSLRFGKTLRQGSQCTLVIFVFEPGVSSYTKVLRRIELLMKKGYIVRLDLSLSEKASLRIDSESRQALDRLAILSNLQISWLFP